MPFSQSSQHHVRYQTFLRIKKPIVIFYLKALKLISHNYRQWYLNENTIHCYCKFVNQSDNHNRYKYKIKYGKFIKDLCLSMSSAFSFSFFFQLTCKNFFVTCKINKFAVFIKQSKTFFFPRWFSTNW